ncbi:endonuclease/exonuclease/phosphatase family protein [Rhodohalobacter mucosus]|uniref:Endonuclease n=1 Tax=Rhodohalobacter mucosus TaxID=2079485 RepID=A0A316TV79_9BACT|nr:endonuclease/exonuclease/phosphatase family protein [Rhodohalobacter mucosus]PWN07681.1 endonuclease [Rhodohalobacter mucosus]
MMKLIGFLILIPLAAMAGYRFLQQQPDGSEQDSEDVVRIMSYNIRFDNPDDGINSWPNRSHHVSHLIEEKYRPDLIGVQEALVHQLEELQDALENYFWVGAGRSDGNRGGEFSPIFYNSNKFGLLQTNTFWLSETPDIPGSLSWDAAITRVVTWARFKEKTTGREFILFNTHFDHMGTESRKESAALLLNEAKRISGGIPFVITGDLNITEESDVYEILKNDPAVKDARYASNTGHQGPTASFNNWMELREPESRIDYIFVKSDIEVLRHQIADDRYNDRFPSDHLPVIADIHLPEVSQEKR